MNDIKNVTDILDKIATSGKVEKVKQLHDDLIQLEQEEKVEQEEENAELTEDESNTLIQEAISEGVIDIESIQARMKQIKVYKGSLATILHTHFCKEDHGRDGECSFYIAGPTTDRDRWLGVVDRIIYDYNLTIDDLRILLQLFYRVIGQIEGNEIVGRLLLEYLSQKYESTSSII